MNYKFKLVIQDVEENYPPHIITSLSFDRLQEEVGAWERFMAKKANHV